MKWHVVKMGFPMFDALHAYGLGVLLSHAYGNRVELSDMGMFYRIEAQTTDGPEYHSALLDDVLAIPTKDELVIYQQQRAGSITLSMANLDGLLAALFTTKGRRLVSVADVFEVDREPEALEEALARVRHLKARLLMWVEKASKQSKNWLNDLLCDYDPTDPRVPTVGKLVLKEVGVLLTLDPALGLSSRGSTSDGLIAKRTNLGIKGARYAGLLAYIGAARFLRAQRIKGNLVLFHVPTPKHVALHSEMRMPLLRATNRALDQTIAVRWLEQWLHPDNPQIAWDGFAYRALQTQGVQQSISIARGVMSNSWLDRIEKLGGATAIRFWSLLLAFRAEGAHSHIDELVSCLLSQNMSSWLTHLYGVAYSQLARIQYHDRTYSVQEVEAITKAMSNSADSPISAILARPQGTLRFGHALRLLGQHKPSELRDLTEALDTVRERDQLMRVLADATAACAVAKAKTGLILVPDEVDFRLLLTDVEQYGARSIATLLIVLSVLRYPAVNDHDVKDELQDTGLAGFALGVDSDDR